MKLGLICLLMCSSLYAGVPTGTLGGMVVDAEGNALHWTRIELLEAGRDTVVEELFGCFIFPFVRPGDYSLALHRLGFAEDTLRNIHVTADSTTFVKIVMDVKPVQMETQLVLRDKSQTKVSVTDG
ncbi:MAG: carboxypeptidase regulatory-like domain-containing protein [Calditrichaeota bacterium]|nr:carboxypeptidase regulatory-like domain-containing protein [Calditrichota bacterium]MCB9391317.1 carboxypeptidase regulatory-like domain-containing protein [Calditrichota bacterium]